MNNEDEKLRRAKRVEDYKARVNWPENSKSPYTVNIQPLEAFDSPNPKGTESVSLQPGVNSNFQVYKPYTLKNFQELLQEMENAKLTDQQKRVLERLGEKDMSSFKVSLEAEPILPTDPKFTKAKKLMIGLIVSLVFIVTSKIIQFKQFLKRRNARNLDNT